MSRWAGLGVVIAVALLLAACGGDDPAPSGDPPILTGLESMPKQLATIVLTDTPTPVVARGEVVDLSQPTATPEPPHPTATLTPYVGIFLGAVSSEEGEPPPTLAPIVINPGAGGASIASGPIGEVAGSCSMAVAAPFAGAYAGNVQQRLGCPVSGGASVLLVMQPFERGAMFWRDTRQIYGLAHSGQFWQIPDGWQEGMPADDPALAPPGGLVQPVRGFGLAWRSNGAVRDALGWGTQPETPASGMWQDFERGAMFTAPDGRVYAIYTAEGQHSGPLSP
jgi:hypothetical protein